jgi:3,4-dihydroxy 2-butanone 4-phosphate synthase / GTP cyclohydrolase II
VVETTLPTAHGLFRAIGSAGVHDRAEHVALVIGPADGTAPVIVHTECVSGDVLRSTACACWRELDDAMARFAADGRGVVFYLRSDGLREPATSSTAEPISTRRRRWRHGSSPTSA